MVISGVFSNMVIEGVASKIATYGAKHLIVSQWVLVGLGIWRIILSNEACYFRSSFKTSLMRMFYFGANVKWFGLK